jgi:hypothetical protein
MSEVEVDLTKIDGDGAFPCPSCGIVLSPDDESDTIYTIVNPEVKGENLEALHIKCRKCKTKIKLIGFL